MDSEMFEEFLAAIDRVAGFHWKDLLQIVPLVAVIGLWWLDRRNERNRTREQRVAEVQPLVVAEILVATPRSQITNAMGVWIGTDIEVRLVNLGRGAALNIAIRVIFANQAESGWDSESVPLAPGDEAVVHIPHADDATAVAIAVACSDVDGREYVITTAGSQRVRVQTKAEYESAPRTPIDATNKPIALRSKP